MDLVSRTAGKIRYFVLHSGKRSILYSARIVSHCITRILNEGKAAILSTAETNYGMIRAAEKAGFRVVESPES